MRFSKIFAFAFVMFAAVSVKAQDIHFSQFYLSPLNLNPAMTGAMDCNIRLVANYRNQWGSVLGANAYNTYSVSYDQKVPVGRYDYVGFGATFWNDVAGEVDFSTLTANVTIVLRPQFDVTCLPIPATLHTSPRIFPSDDTPMLWWRNQLLSLEITLKNIRGALWPSG